MMTFRSISDIRREYGDLNLSDESLPDDPIIQFQHWFEDVLKNEKNDPTAMVFSTVDKKGHPDSRVVLLKGLNEGHFIFYTNYTSTKAKQIKSNPYGALNFYWPQMARQVRIRGQVKKIDKQLSDTYFSSRPIKSQLSAIISPQSKEIKDRKFLEDALNDLIHKYGQAPILRPIHWGGYKIIPEEIEFWQGRDNRLHDRILYYRKEDQWMHHRLAP